MLARVCGHFGRVYFELMRVQYYAFDRLLDCDLDINLSLVSPWFTSFEICERDAVIDGLDTIRSFALAVVQVVLGGDCILLRQDIPIAGHPDQARGGLARTEASRLQ